MYNCGLSGNTIQGFADQKSDENGEINFVGTVYNPGMFPLNEDTGWGKIFLFKHLFYASQVHFMCSVYMTQFR